MELFCIDYFDIFKLLGMCLFGLCCVMLYFFDEEMLVVNFYGIFGLEVMVDILCECLLCECICCCVLLMEYM